MRKKNIVIAGAGFAGQSALRHLLRRRKSLGDGYKLVVIDKNTYSEFLPMLPDVAGGWIDPKQLRFNIEKFTCKAGAEFIKGRVESAKLSNGVLRLDSGRNVDFKYLLVAAGAETNFYGNKGLSDKCRRLDSIQDALDIKNQLIALLKERSVLNIIIIGAGYTGVEIATNIRYLLAPYKRDFSIYIVEKSGEILAALPVRIRINIQKEIDKLGIKVITGDSLKSYDGENAMLESSGEIKSAFCIWTAGVKTPSFIDTIEAQKTRTRLKVDEYMRIKEPFYPNVFVAGDAAGFEGTGTDAPLRMAVMFSIEQGRIASENIIRGIKGQSPKCYKPLDLGYLVPMAHGKAEGIVLGKRMHGALGYFMHYFMCMHRSQWKNKPGIIKDFIRKMTSGFIKNNKGVEMDIREWASIPLRFGLGVMFAAHGLQKTHGLFNGPGIKNFSEMLSGLGFVQPLIWAYLAAYTELIGGICLLIGLATRISALLLFALIAVAGVMVHLKNGFFLMNGGIEYTFIIACMCLSLAVLGTGKLGLSKKL